MSNVFITYSRVDKEFVQRLTAALEKDGREVWVDTEDIPPTAEWVQEIYSGIEGAEAYLFVLSPDSLRSPVCGQELAHALKNNKKLVPLVCREVDYNQAPKPLAEINWLFFRPQDDFDRSLQALLNSLDTDLDWVRAHTRLQVRAIEWQAKGRGGSFLLRGQDLKEAEAWIQKSFARAQNPTQLQSDYIQQSRQAETRRRRITMGAIAAALVVTTALGMIAINRLLFANEQRSLRQTAEALATVERANRATQQAIAEREQALAASRRLANQSSAAGDHSAALLLAVEAYSQSPTNEALGALLTALQAKPGLAAHLHTQYTDILNVVFSQDASRFAITGCYDFKLSRGCSGPEILAFDTQSGRTIGDPQETFSRTEGDFRLAFTPDNNSLAAWDYNGVLLFRIEDGQVLDKRVLQAQPSSVTLAPDGQSLRIDDPSGTALDWRFTGLDYYPKPAPGGELAVLPLEQEIADLTTRSLLGQPLNTRQQPYREMAFQGDELLGVLKQDRTLELWNVSADAPASQAAASGTVISLDQRLETAAVTSPEGGVALWHPATGELQPVAVPANWEEGDLSGVSRLALSPDGSLLAVGYTGFHRSLPLEIAYGVRVYDIASQKLLGEYLKAPSSGDLSQDIFSDLEFTPGGMLAAAYDGGPLFILDPRSGAYQITGDLGNLSLQGKTSTLGFSPDGRWLAVGGPDGAIALWDAATITLVGRLKGYSSPVVSAAFTPDSQMLLSSHVDGSLVLWDLRPASFIERACRQANRDFTQDEWQQYMLSAPYRETCPAQPSRLSDLPGAPVELRLPERLTQPLPEAALPEALRNLQPSEAPPAEPEPVSQPAAPTPLPPAPTPAPAQPNPFASQGSCDTTPPPCTYQVRPGDNFTLIAQAVYGSPEYTPLLLSANRNREGYRPALQLGAPVFVPAFDLSQMDLLPTYLYPECGQGSFPCWHRANAGDTYQSIAARFYGDEAAWQDITRANWAYDASLPEPLTYPQIYAGLVLVLPVQ